jgi:mRNA-degrading endonuclease YafQ of YafQ-DinJ toxin-antitoxin module
VTWQIFQTKRFARAYKRLHDNQLPEVDNAIKGLALNPMAGEKKKGDLSELYVLKFSCLGQQLLLGYTLDEGVNLIYLEALGVHQNLYREIKR